MNSYIEVLNYLLSLDPSFEQVWSDDENYHRNDDGSSTTCGVLSEFSQYLQDHADVLSLPYLKALFELVESNVDAETDFGGSIRACFLENLGYTKAGKVLEKYMGKRSLFYYDGGSFPWNT